MATKTKAKTKRKKCPPGHKWGELPAEEKDPTAGKGGKEKKPIGGKPKMGCVLIEGVVKDKK